MLCKSPNCFKKMPTYEYECARCKKTFEAFQSMKDEAYKTCPKEKCRMKTWGKGKVKRLLGAGAGLIFKGAGFYITDYRSEGYKSAAKKDSTASSPPKADSATTPPQKAEGVKAASTDSSKTKKTPPSKS